ncbi:MAG TPA: RNA-binding domain-containing protein [Longimicrobium sp.]|jgi:hypothetical protein
MAINTARTRQHLQDFAFRDLFVEELGWNRPRESRPLPAALDGNAYTQRHVAELGGAVVIEIEAEGGIPDAKARAAIHRATARLHHENLLIFVDHLRTQSLWFWAKRDGAKLLPREHLYVKGQAGDLFLSKISGMFVELGDLDDEGNIPVVEVARRLADSLDVERVTKKFYREFQEQHLAFVQLIEGIDDERDRRWYASVLLNRLMFIYFLQRKGFLDGGSYNYLQEKLDVARKRGEDLCGPVFTGLGELPKPHTYCFYDEFLKVLFFEGFAKPEAQRSADVNRTLGKIRYLNGGLFLPHRIEREYESIRIPDQAFANILQLFRSYDWNLDDTPGGNPNEISPDVLGYIFEKYINQKAFGAYYTRPEITEYLCEQTIHRLIVQRVSHPGVPGVLPPCRFDSLPDLLLKLDASLCRTLLFDVLPGLTLLDPACGSGAFLVAAMKTLIEVYSAVTGRIEFLNDPQLTKWLADTRREHRSLNYYIKKRIIADNLFGVDLMEEATEIARLRLFLALVSSVQSADQLEPLPNIDFNILAGNSLIGLLRVDEAEYDRRAQGDFFQKSYRQLVNEKNRLVGRYRHHAATEAEDSAALRDLRDEIDEQRRAATENLNALLLDEFAGAGIRYEQATWNAAKGKEGKPKKRALHSTDIAALHPFHWGYEFDEVLNGRGGFDAIITNPPWDVWQTDEKEFFQEYAPEIQKNKLRIEDWKKQHAKLMKHPELRDAWLTYASRFPHVSAWFKAAPQFENQRSFTETGARIASKTNLYTYFVEQCYNLLRPGGECGIVVPSGIYTDLGTKQLREMLFGSTRISGLFGFENRKEIFEGVHRSFKFVVLTFEKGGSTQRFFATFMRLDVEDLARFPAQDAIRVSVDLVRRLSPNSLSIMEFNCETDVQIAEKMLRFPLLGQERDGAWNLSLTQEFNMTTDSDLFHPEPAPGWLPLYEGKMLHQFTHTWANPRYWIDETQGRKRLLGNRDDAGQKLIYQHHLLGYREIARNTDERTMIAAVLPPRVFANHKVVLWNPTSAGYSVREMLFVCAIFNSMTLDYLLRYSVTMGVPMFVVYQLPVPRLTERDSEFAPIVERAARLICTTPEFDDLALEVGLGSHVNGATDPGERARLRAELDGMVAHLYGLTEAEFAHILGTFPLVAKETKDAAMAAYQALTPIPGDPDIARLIAQGESGTLEFKSTARWDVREGKKNPKMEEIIVKTVAAFLNSAGGTLLIGIADDGTVLGLDADYRTLGERANADGFEQWLTQHLGKHIGFGLAPLLEVSFHGIDGKQVCRVLVKSSPKPVWVKTEGQEHFYVRTNNSSRALSAREAQEYAQTHWGLRGNNGEG